MTAYSSVNRKTSPEFDVFVATEKCHFKFKKINRWNWFLVNRKQQQAAMVSNETLYPSEQTIRKQTDSRLNQQCTYSTNVTSKQVSPLLFYYLFFVNSG